jgi:hypothetical protein
VNWGSSLKTKEVATGNTMRDLICLESRVVITEKEIANWE